MEYNSALIKKKLPLHAIPWRKLQDIMLSKTSQSQKNKYYMIPLHEVSKVIKFVKIQSIIMVIGGWREREKEM